MACVFKARVLVAHGCFKNALALKKVQALESGLTEAAKPRLGRRMSITQPLSIQLITALGKPYLNVRLLTNYGELSKQ